MGILSSETKTKPVMLPGAKDLTRRILNQAKADFKKAPTYGYGGSLVSEFHPTTRDAFGGLTTLADNNSGGSGMSPHLQGIMDRGGFTAEQQQTKGDIRGMIDNPGMNALINGDGLTDDQRLVADRYRSGMNEEFGTSEAYNKVRDLALARQRMELDANAAKSGRYGGGSSQSILAREQGNLGATMDVGEMDKWRARTDAAAGNLANLSQTGVTNRAGAIDQKAGLASTLFNAENAGLDNMASAFNTAQQPYLTKRAVGQEYESLNNRVLADNKRRVDEFDPLARQAKYLALATGVPTGQSSTTDPSLLGMIAGGGLGVLGLAGMMNGWGGGGQSAAGSYGTGTW